MRMASQHHIPIQAIPQIQRRSPTYVSSGQVRCCRTFASSWLEPAVAIKTLRSLALMLSGCVHTPLCICSRHVKRSFEVLT